MRQYHYRALLCPWALASLIGFAATAANVPIELNSNKPFLRVQVNQQLCWFILDNGASFNVLDGDRAAALGISSRGQSEERGAGERTIPSATATGVSLALPGLVLPKQEIHVISLGPTVARSEGRAVDGLLGYDFFKRFVVEIDYGHQTVSLHEPRSYRYAGEGSRIPLKILREHGLVAATLMLGDGRKVPGSFLVDTAWRAALTLNAPFVKAQRIEAGMEKRIEVTTGMGIGGPTRDAIGRIAGVQLGPYSLSRPIVGLSQDRGGVSSEEGLSGILGGEILRRFRVIFDYSREQMILEPNTAFAEPYEFDMSGMFLVAMGDRLEKIQVYEVSQGSPAFEAGIRAGDVIEAINGVPAAKLTLDQVRSIFRRSAGKEHLLSIERGGKSFLVKIQLRRRV